MQSFRFSVLLGIAFMLMGPARAAPEISAQEAPPEHIWLADDKGVSVHLVTGLRCPQKAGTYTLEELQSFDRAGFRVSCFYKNPAGDIVTLDIVKRKEGAGLDEHFAGIKTEILPRYKGMVEAPMQHAPVLPRSTLWRSQAYKLPDGRRGGLWVTDYSGWGPFLSALYAPKNAKAAMDAVAQLAVAADTSARERLQICARNTPPAGKGKLLPDEPVELATQALTLLAYQDVLSSGKSAPTHWCAMGYSADDLSMSVWRNVGPEAPVRPVFRITFEADKGPVIFYVVRDSYAVDYFNAEHGYKGAPRDAHVLIGYLGDAVAFGAFDYEPGPNLFGRRVMQVIKQEHVPGIRLDAWGDIWVQGEKIPPEAFRQGR